MDKPLGMGASLNAFGDLPISFLRQLASYRGVTGYSKATLFRILWALVAHFNPFKSEEQILQILSLRFRKVEDDDDFEMLDTDESLELLEKEDRKEVCCQFPRFQFLGIYVLVANDAGLATQNASLTATRYRLRGHCYGKLAHHVAAAT